MVCKIVLISCKTEKNHYTIAMQSGKPRGEYEMDIGYHIK